MERREFLSVAGAGAAGMGLFNLFVRLASAQSAADRPNILGTFQSLKVAFIWFTNHLLVIAFVDARPGDRATLGSDPSTGAGEDTQRGRERGSCPPTLLRCSLKR